MSADINDELRRLIYEAEQQEYALIDGLTEALTILLRSKIEAAAAARAHLVGVLNPHAGRAKTQQELDAEFRGNLYHAPPH